MHKWAKSIMECVKTKVDGKGLDNLELPEVEELEYWTRIAKNITCYDKDYKIVEAMEKSENEENMDMIELFEDYPDRKFYRRQPRNQMGQFKADGIPNRKTFVSPQSYNLTMDLYRMNPYELMNMDDRYGVHYFEEPRMRMTGNIDERRMMMDGEPMNRGYSNSGGMTSGQQSSSRSISNGNMSGNGTGNYDDGYNRGYSEGNSEGYNRGMNDGRREGGNRRIDRARRNYEEKHDQQALNEWMEAMFEEIDEKLPMMDNSQKTLLKTKMQNKGSSIK